MTPDRPTTGSRLRALMAALTLATCLSGTAAWAADQVPVRLGEHKDYTRVVIDFDTLTGYSAKQQGDKITLTFTTPATLSAPSADARLLDTLKSARVDGKTSTLTLDIADGATVKHYRLMRKIVVDIFPPIAAKAAPPQKPDTPPAKITAVKPPAPKPAPVVTAPPAPETAVTAELVIAPVTLPPETAPPAAVVTAAPDVPATTPAPTSAPVTAAPVTVDPVIDVTSAAGSMIVDELVAQNEEKPEPISTEPTKITFSSISPLQMAVFTRGEKLWIVTAGSTGSAQMPEARGPMSGLMGTPDITRFDGGVAYRYRMPPKNFVQVNKVNMTWEVLVAPIPMQAPSKEVVHVEFDRTSGKAKLLAQVKGTAKPLAVQDPDAGDTLQVVPVSLPSDRIDQGRRFSDVDIMPAMAGMVIRPLADAVRVTRIENYVIISAVEGIQASPYAGPVLVTDTTTQTGELPRLFDFPNWRQGGLPWLSKNRRQIEERIAAAPNPAVQDEMLMNLALLYFANNFGQETIAVLRLMEQRNPDMTKNPNFIALRGAASAMAGHYQDALQDLSMPAIQQHPEVNLWIGYAAAATEQWRMASRSFPTDNRLLVQYPENISTPFTLYMAESALRLGRTDTANALLETLDPWGANMDSHHRAALAYLKGESARQQGFRADAMRIWRPVANGLDRLYHTKASLALTNLELSENIIPLQEAIDRIDSLRFAWRGDGLEVQILHNLGLLKVQNKQYLDGLNDMRAAMTLADALLGDTDVIRTDMSRVISDIFIGKQSEAISPLEAISIHAAYGTLMPTGEAGSIATLNFADFLVRMDLLGKAAELIDQQITNNTAPPERVPELGAKLAAIYLLDSMPAPALSALQRSARSTVSPAIEQERQLLRARALSQLTRTDEAIAVLAAMDSPAATRLKADVLWRAKRWGGAAVAIESLLPSPGTEFDEGSAEMVVNAAVAHKLAGNSANLKALRDRYGDAMAATPMANAFGVVTRDGGSASLSDRDTILRIAGEVDMFKGFLKSYHTADKGG